MGKGGCGPRRTAITHYSTAARVDLRAAAERLFSGEIEALDALAELDERVAEMGRCQQEPDFHAEGDVLTHTRMTLDELLTGIDPHHPRRRTLIAAVLCHDIGKPATTVMHPEKQRLISYGHESAGVPIARELLRDLGWRGAERDAVLHLVAQHMRPGSLEKNGSEQSFRRLAVEVGDVRAMLEVLRADRLGRRAADRDTRWESTQATFHARLAALDLVPRPFFDLSNEELAPITDDPVVRTWIRGALAYRAWQGGLHSRESALSAAYDLARSGPRGTLYLPSGAQGSGKSTWSSAQTAAVVSSDAIRAEHRLDPRVPADNQRVFQIASERTKEHMRRGADLIFDATNVDQKRRALAVDLARRYGYRIVGVMFDIEPSIARARNLARPQPVPDEAVRRYADQLMPFGPHEADEVIRPYEASPGTPEDRPDSAA